MRLIDADQFGVVSFQGKSEEFIEGVKFMLEKIDEAPTVERPQWIPCSERLPKKESKIYLVTIDYGDGLSCVAPRFFFGKKNGWNEAEEYITAWMPIPKPYQKEGDMDG